VSALEVSIFEHREAGKPCSESCGTDWLNEENQKLALENVRHRFGERVKLNFYNLADPEVREKFPEILHKVEKEGLYLPLLMIEGEVKISGYFDLRMLLDMIEVAGEVSRGRL